MSEGNLGSQEEKLTEKVTFQHSDYRISENPNTRFV